MLRSRVFRLVIALAVGVAAPYVELAVKCRAPSSEACVWGRSYMPLTRPVYLVLFGGLTYALLAWVARRRTALALALCALLGTTACRRATPPPGPSVCAVVEPGTTCDVGVQITPYVTNGGPFGGFHSRAGTSYQSASATFDGDGKPGVLTTDTKTVTARGITRVVLRPDPLDYVAYRDLRFGR